MKHLWEVLLMTGGLLLSACGLSSLPEQNDTDPVSEAAAGSSVSDQSADKQNEYSSNASSSGSESAFPNLNSFTAQTIDGNSFSQENFAGADVTAINIWSTTCGPCVREMPELAEYAKTLPDNLRIMTWCIDADISMSGAEIDKYLDECGFTGITLASGDGDLQKLYEHLMYTPTTIFVDAKGNLLSEPLIGAGNISERYSSQFQSALEQLGIESSLKSK